MKQYTEEFRIEAVKQVVERGYSRAEVAERLGINRKTLSQWVYRYGPDKAVYDAQQDSDAEIQRLRNELKRVTEERDILKKAAAYFAKESG